MAAGTRGGVGTNWRDAGVLKGDIDATALATGLLAAVEGGYLLSQTARDPRLMQTALNSAIEYIRSFAVGCALTDRPTETKTGRARQSAARSAARSSSKAEPPRPLQNQVRPAIS